MELLLLVALFGVLAFIRIRGMEGLSDIFGSETSAKLDALAKHLKVKFKLIPRHYEIENESQDGK